ncbi:olfactory receptor 52E8-like [Mixophyes fleayi]|uniref:olfactory receptor 52E8-like n=1 Tax=Mixophyes fleayi TaxID=3061075 RepID=UPI003F4E22E1
MGDLALNTSFSHTDFLLCGFPGISQSRHALVIPFLFMYMIIVVSNGVMIYSIWMEKTLHSPMYILISQLFASNISYTTTILPKFLLGLTFELNQVTLTGCFVQMFFIYLTGTSESILLVLMAFDRYVAIRMPLHYHNIVTKRTLTLLIFIGWVRSFLCASLIVIFASKVQFCRSNIILNFACENMSLLNLACGDISNVQAVGLLIRVLITLTDGTFVLVSYLIILCTVMKILIGKASEKAWQTCSTHILVAMLLFSSGMCSSLVYRMGSLISQDVQNLISLMNFVIPTSADPFIYGLRMKEIRTSLKKAFGKRNFGARL